MLSFDVERVLGAEIGRGVDVARVESVGVERHTIERAGEDTGRFHAEIGEREEENERTEQVARPEAHVPSLVCPRRSRSSCCRLVNWRAHVHTSSNCSSRPRLLLTLAYTKISILFFLTIYFFVNFNAYDLNMFSGYLGFVLRFYLSFFFLFCFILFNKYKIFKIMAFFLIFLN